MADASRDVTTRRVPTALGRLHVTDHPGAEQAPVLMHGFLDDSRIYNRFVPLLSPRRAVSFDFLGYGSADRPRRITQRQPACLDIAVGLVFGALDRYLSPDLAAHFASLFPRAGTQLVDGASHWPQWDQPKAVSELIR
jgi:pimeloyl-ACP methyl ester carboxylesterase